MFSDVDSWQGESANCSIFPRFERLSDSFFSQCFEEEILSLAEKVEGIPETLVSPGFPAFYKILQLLKTVLKQTQSMKEDKANSVWLIKERPFISCVRQDARITDREIYQWDTLFSWTWNMVKSGSFCANQLTDSFHFWKALVMRVMQKLSASFNIHAKFAHKLHLTFNYAALTFPLSCKFFYSEGEIRKWKSELERCFFKILTNRIWL